jgi:hypothetical protein
LTQPPAPLTPPDRPISRSKAPSMLARPLTPDQRPYSRLLARPARRRTMAAILAA